MSIISRISAKSITIIIGGRVRTVNANSVNYPRLREALADEVQDLDLIKNLSDMPKFIALETHGRVTVNAGEVRFDGTAIHSTLTKRILQHLTEGISIAPLANFLDRLMNNPNQDIHEDLYAWCESGEMPFTEDGFLIAFKRVQDNYYSFHSGKDGKVLYQLNTIVEINVKDVDPDRYNECSQGLHFCSYGYLKKFYSTSGKVLIVKIDPADVVAIPLDHDRQKGRTFRMEVIDEIPENEVADAFSEHTLVVTDQGSYTAGEESTATVATNDTNDTGMGLDTLGDLITNKTISDYLKTGGVEFTADKLGVDIVFVTGWISRNDFPDEDLGELFDSDILTFERNGVYYTFEDILLATADGINSYSRDEGIPRSTLQSWVKKAKEEELRLSKELKFVHKGNVYLASTISKGIQAIGQTAYSKQTGIPRSTLHGWMKKIH